MLCAPRRSVQRGGEPCPGLGLGGFRGLPDDDGGDVGDGDGGQFGPPGGLGPGHGSGNPAPWRVQALGDPVGAALADLRADEGGLIQHHSARFLAELLGLSVTGESSGSAAAHFAVVRVQDITIDFATMEHVEPHHLAFAVDDETFDAVLARTTAAGLEYSADPLHQRVGELNHNNGGRGFYVRDPDGHNLEFLTRPITG
jgi:catechol 2,3-dioxygenase-like lactoylglutathione lyase family enzyme